MWMFSLLRLSAAGSNLPKVGSRQLLRVPARDGLDLMRKSDLSERVYRLFVPPLFGVTVIGSSHGFDPTASTTGFILWMNQVRHADGRSHVS